jgi:hypothetical protein
MNLPPGGASWCSPKIFLCIPPCHWGFGHLGELAMATIRQACCGLEWHVFCTCYVGWPWYPPEDRLSRAQTNCMVPANEEESCISQRWEGHMLHACNPRPNPQPSPKEQTCLHPKLRCMKLPFSLLSLPALRSILNVFSQPGCSHATSMRSPMANDLSMHADASLRDDDP